MLIDPVTGEVVVPFLRTPYNYDVNAASEETSLDCSDDPGFTQQQFKEECDINVIVEKFMKTGEMPDNVRVPIEGDFTDVTDYQSALNAVIAADDAFMELPPDVRAEFDNNPQKLMDFLADDKNRARAEELGLLNAKPLKAEPIEVRVMQEPAPAGSGPGST